MKALFKSVGGDLKVIEIDNTLEALQDKVGGYIEVLACPVKGVNIICNEEGKLRDLPPNIPLYDRYMNMCDVVVGDILIVGNDSNGEFADLTEEQIKECLQIYKADDVCEAKMYELTVYHTVDGCGYSIAQRRFTELIDMLNFCTAFDTENEDILFDVYSDGAQFNINEAVESIKQFELTER